MERVLVSGGGGYIGSVLCDELLNQGYNVICLDRFFFGKEPIQQLLLNPNFKIIQTDVRLVKYDLLKDVDIVLDLAGISNDPSVDLDPNLSEDINLRGTLNLSKEARLAGVKRYIYPSSCSIYGTGVNDALTETSPLNPVSLYAKLKLQTEKELLKLSSQDFCVTFLRNATVYGYSPRMRFDLIVNIMTMNAIMKHKIYVLGGGKQWRPIVHVKDVAKAFLLTMNSPIEKINGEAFNVGTNEQNYQVIQVANIVCDVLPNTQVEVIPDDADKRNYNVCFDKIQNVLGFKVTHTLYDGIAEIKQALHSSMVDPNDLKTSTVKYYRYLIDADRILQEIKLNGKLFNL